MIVFGLPLEMETNSPTRIAEQTTAFYIDLHARVFCPRLPITFPILQAASIATNVGANPSATSINELIKSTIVRGIEVN
jgi:hypothetical protein